jgi:hypothetical protein
MTQNNEFKRINILLNIVRIATKANTPGMLHNANIALSQYKSRGKNKTASHPKPHAHMALVRAARTKHNKGKH